MGKKGKKAKKQAVPAGNGNGSGRASASIASTTNASARPPARPTTRSSNAAAAGNSSGNGGRARRRRSSTLTAGGGIDFDRLLRQSKIRCSLSLSTETAKKDKQSSSQVAIATGRRRCTTTLNLVIIPTLGDGCCMQNATVAALHRMGVPDAAKYPNPRDLRVAIAKAFLADKDRFFDALPKKYRTRNGPAMYAEEIKAGNAWSDNIELVLMQKLLKRPIHIYSYERLTVTRIGCADDEPTTIAFPNGAVVHEGGEDTRPIMLGYLEDEHYEGLEEYGRRHLIPEPSPTAASVTEKSTDAAAGAVSARRPTRSTAAAASEPSEQSATGAASTRRSTRGSAARTSATTSASDEMGSTRSRRGKRDKEDDRIKPSKRPKPGNSAESSSAMEVDDGTAEEEAPTYWTPSTTPISDLAHVGVGSTMYVMRDGELQQAKVTAEANSVVSIQFVDDNWSTTKDLAVESFSIVCDSCQVDEADVAYFDPVGKDRRNLVLCSCCNDAEMSGNEQPLPDGK